MKAIKAVLMLHWIDTRTSFVIFWSILLAITALSFMFALVFTAGNMFFGGSIAINIYLLIHSVINVRETFPFALGMGSTRKHYYLGTFCAFVILAAVTAIVQSIYHYLGNLVIGAAGLDDYFFVTVSNLSGNVFSPLSILWFDFIIALFVLSIAHVISSYVYRFGRYFTFILLGVFFFAIMTPGVNQLWVTLFGYFTKPNWYEMISIWAPLTSIVAFLISWSFMRSSASRPATR